MLVNNRQKCPISRTKKNLKKTKKVGNLKVFFYKECPLI